MLHENEVLSSEAFINEFSRFPDLQINTKSSLLSNALPMASSDFIPVYSDRIAQDLHLIPS